MQAHVPLDVRRSTFAPMTGGVQQMVFGVFAPQGWKRELRSIDGAEAQWATTVEVARRADELGFDSLWVYDHVHNVPFPDHEAVFECWTTIAALSQQTSRIRLGQMVSCAGYRNPAMVAKITANIDVISGGRLDFGVGAGWYDGEYRAYGWDFPVASDRIRMLRETVEIVKLMWSEADATYEGRHFRVDGAQCDPKPVQSPHPPIWIGGGGEQLTLRVVARHADRSNFGGKPHEWAHKRDVLLAHCAEVGRDPDEIVMTWSPEVFIRPTEAEVVAAGSQSFWGEPFDSWREGNLVGTPEQVCEKLEAYRALGCGGVVPWCSDYPSTETLELFGTRVMPEFR
jgi:F420-dependent oxidoreductase-like protein